MGRLSLHATGKQAGNLSSRSPALVERELHFFLVVVVVQSPQKKNPLTILTYSYAELDPNTRSQFSHRSRALVKLAQYLRHAI